MIPLKNLARKGLRPDQNGSHFADIYKYIFLKYFDSNLRYYDSLPHLLLPDVLHILISRIQLFFGFSKFFS